MKALMCHAYGPIDSLKVEEVPSPQPGPDQVLITVKAAALNFPDALVVQGLYQHKPTFPFSPGGEVAGVIKALGANVTGFKIGDRVLASIGTGGFAQECLASTLRLMPLADGMDFELGAAFTLTYGTSLHALQRCANLRSGETLLVLGAAGGVGLAAIEIGKVLGARVIAAASSEEKLALCRKVGADETINYTTEDLRKRVDALTGDKGADVTYDPVGGKYAEAGLRATAWRGRFLVVGFAAGEIPKIALNLALLKERYIIGVHWGEAVRRDRSEFTTDMKLLHEWFAAGRIRPVISERLDLSQAVDAIKRIANRQVMGKVVVLPNG